ncbi:hypothetical protein TSMEX_005901 [Taenia solium]|eukprot:TsM_000324600 transcript=TsM_000324600 gene=TsM_000324600
MKTSFGEWIRIGQERRRAVDNFSNQSNFGYNRITQPVSTQLF